MITERALNGDNFKELKIIDSHCHLGYSHNFYYPKAGIDELIGDADKMGVEKLCVAPMLALEGDHKLGNLHAYEAAQKYPGRVYGLLVLNPHKPEEADGEIKKYYHLPEFLGVKVHPSGHKYPLTGDAYMEIFEKLEKRGGFVLTHTWEDSGYNDAAACEQVLKTFPSLNFILAHSLGVRNGVYKAIALANHYENAYLDTCGFEFSHVSIEILMRKTAQEKVFYGSDVPYLDIRNGVSRILFADLPDEVKVNLLRHNYERFLLNSQKKEVK
jgi:predicted TIM-barrel fold metal-dependent hydrolase